MGFTYKKSDILRSLKSSGMMLYVSSIFVTGVNGEDDTFDALANS